MKNLSRLLLGVALISLLAGCETKLPGGFPDLRYNHLKPIRLDAVRIELVEQYKSSGTKPYIEHEFPIRPAKVLSRWVRDRLKAVGARNIVRATIVNGAVVEVPLQKSTGIKGAFTTDQSERYDGTLELRIEVIGPGGRQLAMVSSRATRSRTVAENITLADREKVWFRMTESMMNDLNLSLERQTRQHLAKWLR